MLGASAAPTIEPVAKMTAELAPVSACAAASRSTLPRARASLVTSTVAVVSSIGIPARQAPGREPRFIAGTMETRGCSINRRKRARAMRRTRTETPIPLSGAQSPSRPLLARSFFRAHRAGLVDLRTGIDEAGVRKTRTPVQRDRGGEAEEAGAA